MTSDSKRQANRNNAKASTGPKTSPGRARSAKNSFRHGLSLPIQSDPALCEEVQALVRQIAGPHADSNAQKLAQRVAEAQIDITRVRLVREQLLSKNFNDADYGSGTFAGILSDDLQQLAALDRYEARARSRRKLAVRQYDLARQNRPGNV